MRRLRYRVHGGLAHFPGLARPLEVDLDALAPEHACRLLALFETAVRESAAGPAETTPCGADRHRHELSFEDDGSVRTMRCVDGAMGPAQCELVAWIDERRAAHGR